MAHLDWRFAMRFMHDSLANAGDFQGRPCVGVEQVKHDGSISGSVPGAGLPLGRKREEKFLSENPA
jgi:hypothetical protein